MPEVIRGAVRLDHTGIDLVHPVDRMPPGRWPYTVNGRVVEEGRFEGRPGYTVFSNAGSGFHSIRRLNDEDASVAPAGYIYIVGGGGDLYAGTEGALAIVASGFSGDPLSLLTFRPDQSAESWMYVYDRTKMVKVSPAGTVRPIGVPPPGAVLGADYWRPASVDIQTCQGGTAGWTASGSAGAAADSNRVTSTTTIGTIIYNGPPPTVIGTTNFWCIINPSTSGNLAWAGERMKITLNSGGANAEEVFVREIHPAVDCGSIDSINYDSGSTGLCSVVPTDTPSYLARNSMLQLGTEKVRVLAVVMSPNGENYSFRCSTTGTHAAGEAITGLVSWYVFTENVHVAGESITSRYIAVPVPSSSGATTVAKMSKLATINAGRADHESRPISIADDYLHISFFAAVPPNIISLKLRLDVDAQTTALADAFTRNYYEWTITPDQLNNTAQTPTPTNGVWTELVIPLSEGVRFGGDDTRSLANIKAVQVELDMTANLCAFGFDWWYLFGTYGPEVPINSPTGLVFVSRYREQDTGAASVPGPPSRYELFPLREGLLVTPEASATLLTNGADQIDIYRQGGGLPNPTYVGSLPNTAGAANYLIDELPDTSVQANPQADYTLLQPWPILQPIPWTGTANVVGTTVTRVSGTPFNTKLLSNSVILIGGVAYQTYGQPTSANRLELFKSAGTQVAAAFEIASPTLAAQPLQYAFILEGPFEPVAFGLGDEANPGTLYFTNPGNLDAASDQNTLELCPPGEPLISGESWNGLAIVGSRENKFLVRYSYLQNLTFQFSRMATLSGMWSRWACCRGLDGVYSLGRDGIYRTTEQGDEPITNDSLYPMFPHDGEPAKTVNNLAPVDMTALTRLRLSAADQDIYFDYAPVGEE